MEVKGMKYEEGENGKVLVFEESDLDNLNFTKHWDIKEDERDKKYTETDLYKSMEEIIKNENIDVEETIKGNDYKNNPIEFLIKELFWKHKYMPEIEEDIANTVRKIWQSIKSGKTLQEAQKINNWLTDNWHTNNLISEMEKLNKRGELDPEKDKQTIKKEIEALRATISEG